MAELSHVYGWYLMKGSEMLVDIVSFPALGEGSESVETTTLSKRQRTYKPGLKGNSSKDCIINYEPEDYEKILKLEGQELELAFWHGDSEAGKPDGHLGKWNFKGYVEVWKNEQTLNSPPQATVRVTPTTEIKYDKGTEAISAPGGVQVGKTSVETAAKASK